MVRKIQLYITGINYFLKYITIENVKKYNNISNCYCFYCICDQINAALASKRDVFQKHKKIYYRPFIALHIKLIKIHKSVNL